MCRRPAWPASGPGWPARSRPTPSPGQPFAAHVRDAAPQVDPDTDTVRVRLAVEDPRHELKPGLYVTAKLRVPLAQLEAAGRPDRDDWRDRTAAELALHSLPAFADPLPGLEPLVDMAARIAGRATGRTLAIPAPAVIDTGDRKVVFVERMAGMFDGVEVTLGRRCGDHYPVLRGLAPGDRVVTAGAFLLDAETRLNPALAASYFGAGARPARPTPGPPATADDETLIARQKVCPVTDESLGSMGRPVKVMVDGRPVFLCCKACERDAPGRAEEVFGQNPEVTRACTRARTIPLTSGPHRSKLAVPAPGTGPPAALSARVRPPQTHRRHADHLATPILAPGSRGRPSVCRRGRRRRAAGRRADLPQAVCVAATGPTGEGTKKPTRARWPATSPSPQLAKLIAKTMPEDDPGTCSAAGRRRRSPRTSTTPSTRRRPRPGTSRRGSSCRG